MLLVEPTQRLVGTRSWLCAALAVLSIVATAASAHARGLDPSCAAVRIQADKPLPERWAHAVDRLCAVLSERGDLDPNAQLVLHPLLDGGLGLHLELTDGRRAERSVRSTASAVPYRSTSCSLNWV